MTPHQPSTISPQSVQHRTVLRATVSEASSSQPSALNSQPVLDFISSDETIDRYSEVITVAGWNLDRYLSNPVFQNAHNYGDIIFTLGRALITEIRTIAGRQVLFQRIQFATEVNPVARIAYGLYRGQFLNAVSVGFIPLRWEDAESADASSPSTHCRRKYLEQELLEVSAVSIPANPNALALAYRSGAIVKDDVSELLDLLTPLCRARSQARDNSQPSTLNPQPAQPLQLAQQFAALLKQLLR